MVGCAHHKKANTNFGGHSPHYDKIDKLNSTAIIKDVMDKTVKGIAVLYSHAAFTRWFIGRTVPMVVV